MAMGAIVACSSYGKDGSLEKGNAAATGDPSSATTTLNTRISSYLEIDMVTTGPDDANLVRGVAGETDYQKPGPGGAGYIDWTDLGSDAANHLLKDLNAAKGQDPSSFPRSTACVGSSQVLSKMDLTYVASANNSSYAYFAVQRADNNGDAGWYWIFTKKAPRETLGEAPCHSDEKHLVYDISAGDILLAGHFQPSNTPLVKVYKAKADEAGVDALSAVDYTNSRWLDGSASVAAAAVNTTTTPPGSFGADGVSALKNGNLDVDVFAEAAIDLSVFTGGSNSCGATYYGSVITRSSGSGGTSPDLKDLAGPALFNFGTATATATVTGGCSDSLHLVGAGTGPDGNAIANPTCSWSISDGTSVVASATGCDTNVGSLAGGKSYTATLTITDPVCGATQAAGSASVYDPLGVTISANNTSLVCSGDAITYTANATGGTGSYTYTWGAASGCAAAQTCTIDPSDATACTSSTFNVTVSDGTCAPATSKNATYEKKTTVTAAVEQ